MVLVGNKSDLDRAVSRESALDVANRNNLAFFEVSAKTGDGIYELFREIANRLPKEPPAKKKVLKQEEVKRDESGCC